jgi:Leucine-rich repeat (LRR) protein
MFIPKDNRKVAEILFAEGEDRTRLKLARREAEFGGSSLLVTANDDEHKGALRSTKYLSLYNCKISRLAQAKTLAASGALEDLNLGYNTLEELPSALAALAPSLRRLWAEDNRLGPAFPAPVLALTRLTCLNLSGNAITSVPEGLSALRSLEELSIGSNGLTALPDGLGKLTALRTLVLRGNALARLPDSLGDLASLQLLAVNSNALTALPASLGGCVSLTTLLLNSNRLTTLPGGLAGLPHLKKVLAANNNIAYLPLRLVARWAGKLDAGIVREARRLVALHLEELGIAPEDAHVAGDPDLALTLDGEGEEEEEEGAAAAGAAKEEEDGDGTMPVEGETGDGAASSVTTPAANAGAGAGRSGKRRPRLLRDFVPPADPSSSAASSSLDLNLDENPLLLLSRGGVPLEGFRPSQYKSPMLEGLKKKMKK